MERWLSMCAAAPLKGYGIDEEDRGALYLAILLNPIDFEWSGVVHA